ncbi:MAG: hypothetical protein RBS56_01690 [Candidatus Gracilibacteria bacterium]|jgi:hypothetical protein|nr:hypothetical protein [Candidatus Gracilibacteria bacterium]
MKNKFLLMAVISALAALVIVPSTMAVDSTEDVEVSTSIISGEFLFTASGVFESPISLGGYQIPNVDTWVSVTNTYDAANWFQLHDYDGVAGATIGIGLTTDFLHTASTTYPEIPGESFLYSLNDGEGAATCAKDIYDVRNGCTIVLARTSLEVSDPSNYTIFDDFTNVAGDYFSEALVGDYSTNKILSTTTTYPYEVRFGLGKFKLEIPANIKSGEYTSTLYLLAMP